jgi:hypothetical protein
VADWEALHRYIKANYKISEDNIDAVTLLFDVDGSRSQVIVVNRAGEVNGSEWAVISTAVCEEGDASPREALLKSADMIVGGLALFEEPLKIAIHFGDLLERELTGADKY